MKCTVRHLLLLSVACVGPIFADSLMITSPGYGGSGNIMANVYVNPYDAKLTTSSGAVSNITVFCDDYYSHVSIGSPWQVNTTSFDDLATNLGQTRWGAMPDAVTLYREAAWLTLQLLSAAPDKTTQGQISFAIWGLFAPTSVDTLGINSTNWTAARDWIQKAKDASVSFTASQFSNFVLYTPTTLNPPNTPQEFIAIRTPEPGVIAIWAVNLLALAGTINLLRKRMSVH